jgi:isoamylase
MRRIWALIAATTLSLLNPQQSEAKLGAALSRTQISFEIFSSTATRVEVYLYDRPFGVEEKLSKPLVKNGNIWSTSITQAALRKSGVTTFYYGYRMWGPNWVYDSSWKKGSAAGFVSDVDSYGNRFNPNKLLLDPYAKEISHDPVGQRRDGSVFEDKAVFTSGSASRNRDSGTVAPKGIVLAETATLRLPGPERALKDESIYEVHMRGFTANDQLIEARYRGTYKGAGLKAKYLKDLGITAVEFLPVQETQNDQNDLREGTDGDNYWGYMTLGYFAPDRRYAADKSAGGPTREFREMVEAFHRAGVKVYIDVVYNHTGEGGVWNASGDSAELYSFRGIDNRAYYLLPNDTKFYWDSTGCGNTFNSAEKVAADLIVDSVRHWKDLGVDGFRFDLAATLGNRCTFNCNQFDKTNPQSPLNRLAQELPSRDFSVDGVDLIAEPWSISNYEVGNFPRGWAEWNGQFRDTLRKTQNRRGYDSITAGSLASVFSGSAYLFQDDGRKPFHSVNFIVAHDGFTLKDLFAFNSKVNNQPWPYGASDGGEDNNNSWDQGGNLEMQRQASRTAMALMILSAGTPMITGGDEFLRSQNGNNNAYNLDSIGNFLRWSDLESPESRSFHHFSKILLNFRKQHPALRRSEYFDGQDHNGNGVPDIQWFEANGREARGDYMRYNQDFLAFRIDAKESGDSTESIFIAYNASDSFVSVNLPQLRPGKSWHRVADTAAWFESDGNAREVGKEDRLIESNYGMHPRTVTLFIEK